jgi:ethanolamine utilization microcompartment shell protein EutS
MRDNLARQRVETIATQEVGAVIGASGRSFRVRVGSGDYEARRAVSCLVEPELGDRVLLALHDEGCHVLAVLDRDGEAPTRIVAEGDLEVSAPAGRFTVAAQEGICFVTPGDAALASGKVRVTATEGSLAVGTLSYLGDQLVAQVGRVKTVARSVESVADRWVQRLDRAYRFIAQSEQVRTQYYEINAKAALNLKAETTIVSSGELTKINGGQIHLG